MTGKRKRGTAYNPTKTNKRKKRGEFILFEVWKCLGVDSTLLASIPFVLGLALTPTLASVAPSSPRPYGDYDEDTYYQVRTVLDERVFRKKVEYQIDWEDDARTGEKYAPTWEPKENLTERALADWEALKLARQAGMSNCPICVARVTLLQ